MGSRLGHEAAEQGGPATERESPAREVRAGSPHREAERGHKAAVHSGAEPKVARDHPNRELPQRAHLASREGGEQARGLAPAEQADRNRLTGEV